MRIASTDAVSRPTTAASRSSRIKTPSDLSNAPANGRPQPPYAKALLDTPAATTTNTSSALMGWMTFILRIGTSISNTVSLLLFMTIVTHSITGSQLNTLHKSHWLMISFILTQGKTASWYILLTLRWCYNAEWLISLYTLRCVSTWFCVVSAVHQSLSYIRSITCDC
jgi:hypothetical protein